MPPAHRGGPPTAGSRSEGDKNRRSLSKRGVSVTFRALERTIHIYPAAVSRTSVTTLGRIAVVPKVSAACKIILAVIVRLTFPK